MCESGMRRCDGIQPPLNYWNLELLIIATGALPERWNLFCDRIAGISSHLHNNRTLMMEIFMLWIMEALRMCIYELSRRARKSSTSPPVYSGITNLQPRFIHSNSIRTRRSMLWNSNFSTLRNCLCARIGFGAGWWRFKLTAVNFTVFFSRFFCVEIVLNKTRKKARDFRD